MSLAIHVESFFCIATIISYGFQQLYYRGKGLHFWWDAILLRGWDALLLNSYSYGLFSYK
jgi:hypothetical protein